MGIDNDSRMWFGMQLSHEEVLKLCVFSEICKWEKRLLANAPLRVCPPVGRIIGQYLVDEQEEEFEDPTDVANAFVQKSYRPLQVGYANPYFDCDRDCVVYCVYYPFHHTRKRSRESDSPRVQPLTAQFLLQFLAQINDEPLKQLCHDMQWTYEPPTLQHYPHIW